MLNLTEGSRMLFTTDNSLLQGQFQLNYNFPVGKSADISCRTSDPKIPVTIYKRNGLLSADQLDVRGTWAEVYIVIFFTFNLIYAHNWRLQVDLSADEDSNWFFDPYRGVVINQISWADEGVYACLALTSNTFDYSNITVNIKLVGEL